VPLLELEYLFLAFWKFLVWTPQRNPSHVCCLGWMINSIPIILFFQNDQQPMYILKCFIFLSGYTRHKGVKLKITCTCDFRDYHSFLMFWWALGCGTRDWSWVDLPFSSHRIESLLSWVSSSSCSNMDCRFVLELDCCQLLLLVATRYCYSEVRHHCRCCIS
jgi:hypothetical protein